MAATTCEPLGLFHEITPNAYFISAEYLTTQMAGQSSYYLLIVVAGVPYSEDRVAIGKPSPKPCTNQARWQTPPVIFE